MKKGKKHKKQNRVGLSMIGLSIENEHSGYTEKQWKEWKRRNGHF